MRSETIEIRTGTSAVVHDLTRDCERFVGEEGDGLLNVYVPHATAGVTTSCPATTAGATGTAHRGTAAIM